MPNIFKRCDLCDGVGQITIINPITGKDSHYDKCPICRGVGGFNIFIGYDGKQSYDWRYKKDRDTKSSGDNL